MLLIIVIEGDETENIVCFVKVWENLIYTQWVLVLDKPSDPLKMQQMLKSLSFHPKAPDKFFIKLPTVPVCLLSIVYCS